MKHKPGPAWALLFMVCAASFCRAAEARYAIDGQSQPTAHSRRLHTALLIAKDQQDNWRGLMNALMGAIVGAFTKESLDAASQLASNLLAPDTSSEAAGHQQPTAQLIQLPPSAPQSGLVVTTSTPVDVGAPVTVDTPVKQTNVQFGGR